MKKLKISLIAILAIIAAVGSSFTPAVSSSPNTMYYFSNTLAKTSPTNSDFDFQGTTDPTVSHCDPGTPICYVSSSQSPDANGHPRGSVTTVLNGKWK